MKLRRPLAYLICVAATLLVQSCVEYVPSSAFNPPPSADAPPYAEPGPQPAPPPAPPPDAWPDDALVAPIALYPDPLIALILPASTSPGDITAASAFLVQYGDATRVDSQPWDPSVRALAHYPTVIAWMAENIGWTQALGSAFLSSPASVMDAVQRLRARALAAGALASTAQQQVYADDGRIEIYPAQPDSIYIPAYDDTVVYSGDTYTGYGGPFISFGDPCPAGPWLSFYFDWGQHRVWAGDRSVWRQHEGWRPPHTGGDRPPGSRPWRPPARGASSVPPAASFRGSALPHPRPMVGAPRPPAERLKRPADPQALAPRSAPGAPVPRTAAPLPGQPRGPAAGGQPPSPARPRSLALPPAPARSPSTPPARGNSPAPAARSDGGRASAPPTSPTASRDPQK